MGENMRESQLLQLLPNTKLKEGIDQSDEDNESEKSLGYKDEQFGCAQGEDLIF